MNLGLMLAVDRAVFIAQVAVSVVLVALYLLLYRIQYGEWWWDEAADGLESGRG